MIKKAHFFWSGKGMSWLRYLTLWSFRKFNPDWEATLYTSAVEWKRSPVWKDPPHKVNFIGRDWFPEVEKLGVKVASVDFEKIGFTNDAHGAHKSDFLRWYLLDTIGGFWSDLDILYFHPLPAGDIAPFQFSVTADPWPATYYIAYVAAEPGTPITRALRRESARQYREDQYQSIGSAMFHSLYPDARRYHTYHPGLRVGIIPAKANIPVPWGDVGHFFAGHCGVDVDLADSIGLHWFGGSDLAGAWENLLTPETVGKHNSLVCDVIEALMADKPLPLYWSGQPVAGAVA